MNKISAIIILISLLIYPWVNFILWFFLLDKSESKKEIFFWICCIITFILQIILAFKLL